MISVTKSHSSVLTHHSMLVSPWSFSCGQSLPPWIITKPPTVITINKVLNNIIDWKTPINMNIKMNIQLDVDSTLIKRFITLLKLHIGMTKSWRTSWTSLGGTRMKHESTRCFVAQASGKTSPVAVEKGHQKKERFGEDLFLGGMYWKYLSIVDYMYIYI